METERERRERKGRRKFLVSAIQMHPHLENILRENLQLALNL